MGNPKKHAKYSPSSSDRWGPVGGCPGSLALIEKVGVHETSAYAEEGTTAHEPVDAMAQVFLVKGAKMTEAQVNKLTKKYGDEMIQHAAWAIKEVRQIVGGRKVEYFSEVKADCSHIDPNFYGTSDIVAVEEFGTLFVFDYKYGAGIAVDASDEDPNTQMLSYAIGTAKKFDYNFSQISMTILQPRAFHEKGPVRTWTISLQELLKWEARFKAAIEATKKPDAPLIAWTADKGSHDWCRFCPAAASCPAVSDKALAQANIDFAPELGVVATPKEEGLTPEMIALTLPALDKLETWIGAVRSRAFQLLSKGTAIPGFKLVRKKASRVWIDEKATAKSAKKKFKDKAFTVPELLSPAQLEKIAGKDWVSPRVTSVSSGLKIADESDKSPGVTPAVEDFNDTPPVALDFETRSKAELNAPGSVEYSRSKVSPKSRNVSKRKKGKK